MSYNPDMNILTLSHIFHTSYFLFGLLVFLIPFTSSHPCASKLIIMSDSDSDNDYVDINEPDEDDNVDDIAPKKSGKGRGPDIDWVEIDRFSDVKKYQESEYFKDIREHFTMRKAREGFYADTEHFTCKHARKRGYMKCPIEYKVAFMTTSEEVVVTTNCKRHIHKEDPEYSREGVNLVWSDAQTKIVMEAMKNEASTATTIRQLQDANVFPEGKFPSRSQITVKIRHCRNILRRTIQIFNTHELRMQIQEKLEVPLDDTEAYIAYNSIDDENEEEEPRFSIIWTSTKLLARVGSEMTQDDATYR